MSTKRPRGHPKTRWAISEWEFCEAVRRTHDAMRLPKGQRTTTLRSIASEYEVSIRTLHRWRNYKVKEVRLFGYAALFTQGTGSPAQVTRWEKAA